MKHIVSTIRKGKAGELLVANELLRRDLDVFMPLADTGIDLICLIDNKSILIQVKESREYVHKDYTRFWFNPKKSSLIKNDVSNMVYIFVLKGEVETHYAVVPSFFLVNNLDNLDVGKTGNAQIYFQRFPDGRVIEGRKEKLDFTDYIDNFKLLKELAKENED